MHCYSQYTSGSLYTTQTVTFLQLLCFPQREHASYVIIQNFQAICSPSTSYLCKTLRIPYRIQHPVQELNELAVFMSNLGVWKPVEMWLVVLHAHCKQVASENFSSETMDVGWIDTRIEENRKGGLETLLWLHLLKWPRNLFLLIITMPTALETNRTTISANWQPSEGTPILHPTSLSFFFCYFASNGWIQSLIWIAPQPSTPNQNTLQGYLTLLYLADLLFCVPVSMCKTLLASISLRIFCLPVYLWFSCCSARRRWCLRARRHRCHRRVGLPIPLPRGPCQRRHPPQFSRRPRRTLLPPSLGDLPPRRVGPSTAPSTAGMAGSGPAI